MENQMNHQASNAAFIFQPSLSKKANSLRPLSNRGKVMNEQIHPDDVQILNDTQSGQFLKITKDNYSEQQVPIVKITKKNSKVNLIPKSKNKQEAFPQVVAQGILIDFNQNNMILNGYIDFQGNFKGIFQKQSAQRTVVFYFEGEITNLKILKINGQLLTDQQRQLLKDLNHIKGYFKGNFYSKKYLQEKIYQTYIGQQQYIGQKIIQESASKVQYHVPALVRMEIRKITQINLKKSSASIAGMLKIDIQLNQEVLDLIYDKDQESFKKKYKLNIDFHRGKPFVLPFYDPQNFDETDGEQQYEWDDVWQGIDLQVQWKLQLMRMSYKIRTTYTAQIDNSHGIFYAPFNLNILKIVIDLHSIKVNSKTKICINCCELTDFNHGIPYTPYTYFDHLLRDQGDRKDHEKMYKKHIDRLNKIDTTRFVDQGQFKVANNRLALFPYYKRVFKNKNNITSDLYWTIGAADKNSLLETPQVQSVKQNYQNHLINGEHNILQLEQWQFIHIQIPIFKYPVIDIIRIFVPITILSAISLTIFWQQNANDYNGFTELAKRIASGCSLMIAYVALIPMIRSNLPPTPSVTLIEILIYLSVIPNFLAIVSTLITTDGDTDYFFATYKAFIDPLYLISFIICCLSMIVLTIMIITYAKKDYKSDFTINKFHSSPLVNLRAPTFLQYIQKINGIRRQYEIEKLPIPYNDLQKYQQEQD